MKKTTKFLLLCLLLVIAGVLGDHFWHMKESDTAAVTRETVVGYLCYDGEKTPFTFGDLAPAYLEAGEFPNDDIRKQLQNELFESYNEYSLETFGELTTEDEVRNFANSRDESGYTLQLLDTYENVELALADIPLVYRQNGFDEAAKYFLEMQWKAKEQNLKAPGWMEFDEENYVLCAAPDWFTDLFTPNSVAVKAWLWDGMPTAKICVETGTSVVVDGRFTEENEEGYLFEYCFSDAPCTSLVNYNKDTDAFTYKTEKCNVCIEATRTWRGRLNEDLPQSIEECFEPICGGDVNPILSIPVGDWTAYELTCVYTGQSQFYADSENFANVEVYNADLLNEDGTHSTGCLILRQDDGTSLWVDGAVLCEVKYDELRLWNDNATTPSVDITIWPATNGGWVISE